jgi:hypothetical protein
MALLQAWGVLALLNYNQLLDTPFNLGSFETLTQIVTLTAGSVVLMWLGELITEKGIGNGVSFIIFAGIVSRAPGAAATFFGNPDIARLILFAIFAIGAVAVIIYVQEGQRRIPIQYASRVRGRRMYQGGQTFLPLRVNQAGVIPIIFAVSILLFPAQIASYFTASEVEFVRNARDLDHPGVQPGLAALRGPVLPADVRVHVLLHRVHVQARRDRGAAAQERRVHPGHPAGPAHPGLPGPRGHPDHRGRRPVPGAVAALPPFVGLILPAFGNSPSAARASSSSCRSSWRP